MRITIDKWNKGKNKFEYDEMSKLLCDADNTMALVPFTDEAKTHLLLTKGIVIDESGTHFNMINSMTSTPIGSVGCGIARLKNNNADLIRIGDSSFDPKLLRNVLKHYNRQNDALHIFGSQQKDNPIKILTPCLDWLIFIAPRVEDTAGDATLLGLNDFDYGVIA